MLHGEYKVPDGKLVAADVEVADGRLSQVRISGDFFLEPDEALDEINRSMRGAAVNADVDTLTTLVRDGMDPQTRMVGFGPESVAVAVRRAVTGSTGWRDHAWKVIREQPRSPLMHMALDQVLAEEVAAGRRSPTLRFWEWADPSVIIGSFQSVRNEVDMPTAEHYGIEVVRRITGGGAMFVEPGNTVTYSLYAPNSLVAGMSFADSYAFLDDWVLEVLRELGMNVWYQPLNDITSDGGKIGGAAQKRVASGSVLHHVTMSYDVDVEKLGQVLRVGGVKLSDKGVGSVVKRVDPLRRQTGLERQTIIDRLESGFRGRYGVVEDRIGADEQRRAEELIETKFATAEWFQRVP